MTPEPAEQLLAEAARLFQAGKFDDAEAAGNRLLEQAPRHPLVLQLLGFINFSQGKPEAAIDFLKRAAQAAPEIMEVHFNLAKALENNGQLEEAAAGYREAQKRAPDDPEIFTALGRTLGNLRRHEESETCFRQAIALSPETAAYHVNLGNILSRQRCFAEAEACHRKALGINNQLAPAHNGLGHALLEQGQAEPALDAIKQALILNPEFINAHINLGNALKASGQISEAIRSYREALQRDPKNADAHFNLSLTLLLAGELTEGWREYEWRWQWEYFTIPKPDLPHRMWPSTSPGKLPGELPGESSIGDFTGKSVIAWGEQGIGDEIMFANCLPDLLQEAATVMVECEPRLLPIYKRSFSGVEFIAKENPPAPALVNAPADYQVALGSLGQRYRPSAEMFPKHDGYLKADEAQAEKFKQKYRVLFPNTRLIGISWKSGNAELGAARSASLDLWQPVLEHADCAFINLQYGDVQSELKNFTQHTGFEIYDDASIDPLMDMDSFAAQIAALDLVISIDNSTVHLAGALGVPTWTLLPAIPDWRWMLERHDTPWYPAMGLFRRQPSQIEGGWQNVFNQVSKALADFRV